MSTCFFSVGFWICVSWFLGVTQPKPKTNVLFFGDDETMMMRLEGFGGRVTMTPPQRCLFLEMGEFTIGRVQAGSKEHVVVCFFMGFWYLH